MCFEGLVHHVVDDGARSVEGAGLLAGGGLGFLVVGGEEVLENFAEEFGIEGDFLVDGSVLDNSKFVAVEDVDEAGDFLGFALFVAVSVGEVGGFAAVEEEAVWDGGTLFGVAGEAVEVALCLGSVVGAVETLEEAAVEEGDVGEKG